MVNALGAVLSQVAGFSDFSYSLLSRKLSAAEVGKSKQISTVQVLRLLGTCTRKSYDYITLFPPLALDALLNK